MKRAPFFARFLENQRLNRDEKQQLAGGGISITQKITDVAQTEKYPSDDDEPYTEKYPSDDDESFTEKWPSDDDE